MFEVLISILICTKAGSIVCVDWMANINCKVYNFNIQTKAEYIRRVIA